MSVFMMVWLTPLIQKKPENEAGLLRIWDYFICSGEFQAPAFATAVIVREVIDQAVVEKLKGFEAIDYLQENLAKISENLVLSPKKADWVVHQAALLHQQLASNPVRRMQFNNLLADGKKHGDAGPVCPFQLPRKESVYQSQVPLSHTVSLVCRRHLRPIIEKVAVRFPETLSITYSLLVCWIFAWLWSVFGVSSLLTRVDPIELVG